MSFLYFLAEHRNTFLTILFELARFTSEEVVALLIIGYLYFLKDKKLAYNIGFTFFFACLFANTLKILFRVPRPWVLDPNFKPLDSAIGTATGYSFPSIHSQSSIALYGTLGCSTNKKGLKIACVVIFLMVGISRMYAGVHTLKDVAVGLLIGGIAVAIEQIIVRPMVEREDPAIAACIILALGAIASVITASVLISKGVLDAELAADAFKIAGSAFAFAIAYPMDVKVIHFNNEGTKKHKIIRLVIGVVSLLAFKEIFKMILSPMGNIGHFIRYVIVIAWILIVYPMILMAINRKKGYNN